MLNVYVEYEGFTEFESKLMAFMNGGLIRNGFTRAVNKIRDVVIEGNPVGIPGEDEHPGLMKKSWEAPKYSYSGRELTATVHNTVEYGMAENYGHFQQPGRYVPAIHAVLKNRWIPGTYALEKSLDEAEYKINPIIREELLKTWNDERTNYYNRKGQELNLGDSYDDYDDEE